MNAIQNGQLPFFAEEPACAKYCPDLSFKQRLIGFGGCAAGGWFLSFMGAITLVGGATQQNITTFCVLYVIGNVMGFQNIPHRYHIPYRTIIIYVCINKVIALCATGFLLGPRSQCRQMWHPTRRYSTIFYLVMLIIVFAVAVAKQNIGVVLSMLFIEILAALWYSISFIPFGRKTVIAVARRTVCKPCFELYDEAKGQVSSDSKSSGGGGSMMSGTKGFTFLEDK